jgi:hypothetical protein
MKNLLFVIIIILLIVLIWKVDKVNKNYINYEHFNDANFSSESLRNIAKVYGDVSGTVTFNNVKVTNALTVDTSFNMLPRGCIIAYNAEVAPAGWAICDGSNNTPDLRGRFIRMWYQRKGEDIWGDELPVVMPNARTDVCGNSEKCKSSFYGDVSSNYTTKMMNHWFGDKGGTDWREPIVKEMARHTHTHTAKRSSSDNCGDPEASDCGNWGGTPNFFKINSAGESWGYGIQPPFYVLTYIMKL